MSSHNWFVTCTLVTLIVCKIDLPEEDLTPLSEGVLCALITLPLLGAGVALVFTVWEMFERSKGE